MKFDRYVCDYDGIYKLDLNTFQKVFPEIRVGQYISLWWNRWNIRIYKIFRRMGYQRRISTWNQSLVSWRFKSKIKKGGFRSGKKFQSGFGRFCTTRYKGCYRYVGLCSCLTSKDCWKNYTLQPYFINSHGVLLFRWKNC